jgi:hypothetical protein
MGFWQNGMEWVFQQRTNGKRDVKGLEIREDSMSTSLHAPVVHSQSLLVVPNPTVEKKTCACSFIRGHFRP